MEIKHYQVVVKRRLSSGKFTYETSDLNCVGNLQAMMSCCLLYENDSNVLSVSVYIGSDYSDFRLLGSYGLDNER